MGKTRFQQTHRYFTIRDGSIYPPSESEDYWWHLEPVASMIRLAILSRHRRIYNIFRIHALASGKAIPRCPTGAAPVLPLYLAYLIRPIAPFSPFFSSSFVL